MTTSTKHFYDCPGYFHIHIPTTSSGRDGHPLRDLVRETGSDLARIHRLRTGNVQLQLVCAALGEEVREHLQYNVISHGAKDS